MKDSLESTNTASTDYSDSMGDDSMANRRELMRSVIESSPKKAKPKRVVAVAAPASPAMGPKAKHPVPSSPQVRRSISDSGDNPMNKPLRNKEKSVANFGSSIKSDISNNDSQNTSNEDKKSHQSQKSPKETGMAAYLTNSFTKDEERPKTIMEEEGDRKPAAKDYGNKKEGDLKFSDNLKQKLDKKAVEKIMPKNDDEMSSNAVRGSKMDDDETMRAIKQGLGYAKKDSLISNDSSLISKANFSRADSEVSSNASKEEESKLDEDEIRAMKQEAKMIYNKDDSDLLLKKKLASSVNEEYKHVVDDDEIHAMKQEALERGVSFHEGETIKEACRMNPMDMPSPLPPPDARATTWSADGKTTTTTAGGPPPTRANIPQHHSETDISTATGISGMTDFTTPLAPPTLDQQRHHVPVGAVPVTGRGRTHPMDDSAHVDNRTVITQTTTPYSQRGFIAEAYRVDEASVQQPRTIGRFSRDTESGVSSRTTNTSGTSGTTTPRAPVSNTLTLYQRMNRMSLRNMSVRNMVELVHAKPVLERQNTMHIIAHSRRVQGCIFILILFVLAMLAGLVYVCVEYLDPEENDEVGIP